MIMNQISFVRMEDGDLHNSHLTNGNLITDITVMTAALKYNINSINSKN